MAMLSITKDCLTTAEGGKPDDTVLAEKVKLLGKALMQAVTAPQGPLSSDGGYPVNVITSLAFLQNLVLPSLCILCQRWASLFPGVSAKKKNKKGGGGDGDAADGGGGKARAELREVIEQVTTNLTTLQSLLEATGRRSAACVALEKQGVEWEAFLGEGETAGPAVKGLLKELSGASTASLAGFAASLKADVVAVKAAVKNL